MCDNSAPSNSADIERQMHQFETFEGRFRPSKERLRVICARGAEMLDEAAQVDSIPFIEQD